MLVDLVADFGREVDKEQGGLDDIGHVAKLCCVDDIGERSVIRLFVRSSGDELSVSCSWACVEEIIRDGEGKKSLYVRRGKTCSETWKRGVE